MVVFLLPLIYAPVFYLAFSELWSLAIFVGGLYLGVLVMWADRVFGYRYYAEPNKPVQLITRSLLFILAYLAIALYVVTSTGSHLGIGLVQGIALVLAWELLNVRKNPTTLNALFFAESKNQLTIRESQWLVWGFIGFFVFTSILVFNQ